jgi:replication factor C subunit 2/4
MLSELTDRELYQLRLQQTPWIEKYRPKKITDIVLDESIINKINKIISDKDMPNIIITGMPGIGKTTTIKCISRALYKQHINEAVLELNASDDRGIKAQDPIITFCRKKLDLNKKDKDKDTKEFAEHKIIILDEADNMTEKAQHLINTLMENHHKTTRFAFTCNNSSDIIEAIQSRCIIFRYLRLSKDQIIKRLNEICEMENVKFDKIALTEIAILSQGDMRHAINNLQLTHNAFRKVTIENVYKMCEKPQRTVIKQIFDECNKKNIKGAIKIILELKNNGYSGSDIVLGMINTLKLDDFIDLTDDTKIKYMDRISHTAYIISKGLDTNVQLIGCIAELVNF